MSVCYLWIGMPMQPMMPLPSKVLSKFNYQTRPRVCSDFSFESRCIKVRENTRRSISSIRTLKPNTMKISLAFILVAAACVCTTHALGGTSSEGFDYVWGAKVAASQLIAREVVYRSKTLLGTTTKTYTLTQDPTAPKTIQYIAITNLKRMRGATAEITSGGVGSQSVTIKFTSARGGAIKSQVEIWGA
ncbi:uncharacterized protein LOC6579941 [Drosophila mojavensis]|uniref:Uncharacterized protein n=1 Tax=Drosophila mojavensis TaxID=7230 RepID=B4KLT9_DROMO|nr:uncharacterized protein LOC6579941 [Drosophila mojavensis]EDW09749.2 uncharacterized protein Dmoj_GI20673 [Drosophila mojavensis]